MAATIDEITYDYEEDGKPVRRQIEKEVLTKGAWSTVMFLYEEMDRRSGKWSEPKIAIVRFKKTSGQYRKQSSFKISSRKQAQQIVERIGEWYGDAGSGTSSDDGPPDEDD